LHVVIWILAGGILGIAAHELTRTRNLAGFALNIVTGIGGVLSGGWLVGVLTGMPTFNPEHFFLASLLVSLLAATVLLMILHLIRRSRMGETTAILADGAWAALEPGGPDNHYQPVRTDMNERTDSGPALRPLMAASLAGILVLVGACASAPLAPDSALDGAKVAIANADKAGAGEHANAELAEARARLTLADNAVKDEDMVVAERFARESQVQAELASARTEAAKAAAVNRDMERGTEAMTEEMQRAGDRR
jgi:uncharacterized membrane protein YeaQ/YmgE (transglycosylase-associated protein family)